MLLLTVAAAGFWPLEPFPDDARGDRTTYSYDALNRQIQVTDALGDLLTTVFDAAGNTIATVDPLGHRTTLGYDALGRQITSTNPLGFVTTSVYDAAGNVLAVTNPRGYATSYAYLWKRQPQFVGKRHLSWKSRTQLFPKRRLVPESCFVACSAAEPYSGNAA